MSRFLKKHCEKSLPEQQLEPMCSLGDRFRGSLIKRRSFETEAYALFLVFNKMAYMFQSPFTDYRFTGQCIMLWTVGPSAKAQSPVLSTVKSSPIADIYFLQIQFATDYWQGFKEIFFDYCSGWTRDLWSKKAVMGKLVSTYEGPTKLKWYGIAKNQENVQHPGSMQSTRNL